MTFIRWGRSNCTSETELLYMGRAAGAYYIQEGGGSNYLCLPDQQEFLDVAPGPQTHRSKVYGTEFEIVNPPSPSVFSDLHNFNVPCAACYASQRGAQIMIPGVVTCPSSWNMEYYGYLIAESFANHRMSYECMDISVEGIPGSEANDDVSARIYLAEGFCHGVTCPPYQDGFELPCVVCTK